MATAAGEVTDSAVLLPKLAVVFDFPVMRTGGGSLLLQRLLATYPPDRLLVVHNPDHASDDASKRLPGVAYRTLPYRIPRAVRNRLNPFWPAMTAVLMRRYAGRLCEQLHDFAPDAILTVAHWYLWFAAAAAARRLGVPLHLILHDDWPSLQTGYQTDRVRRLALWACRRVMGRVYRQARSRLCVSPGMLECCRDWFGADGSVLYPSRGEDSPTCRVRVRRDAASPLVVAFCGLIHQGGTADLLRQLASILAPLNGHLDLYTTYSSEELTARGLGAPTVRVRGFLPSDVMGERLGQTAHALFLPASFQPREREDVATLFPSKLADYTAIGLPVLVWGPAYSSAVRWAAENPDAAIRITDPDPAPVRDALLRLAADPAYAARLAEAAIVAGKRYFEPAAVRKVFHSELFDLEAT